MVLVQVAVANMIVFPEGVESLYALSFKKTSAKPGDVGSRVARNIHDAFFALETSVGLEVRAKGLTCPGEVALGGDEFRKGVLYSDGWWCAGGTKQI